MLIFAIDDEQAMLAQLHEAIEEAEPDAQIMDFTRASDALKAITEQGIRPEVVFSDIELPGMDGLSFAVRIKNEAPAARIVFVTGYSQYAVEAYRRHVSGYVMKPVDAAIIRDELDHLPALPERESKRLYVRCFGSFEVFWDGKPLAFGRRKTKELFAYLIDRRGSFCTAEEIVSALWEEEPDVKKSKHLLRTLISDLRSSLRRIGMEELLIRKSGLISLDAKRIPCDYYQMLHGDVGALNAYHGEYMTQYSWGELTAGSLWFQSGSRV